MSDFEKIYKIVRKIPAGKVGTYGQVGKLAGVHPRVVGMAMNKNPHPVIMPCHRIVGHDGNLVGYALGLDKKRELLAKEGAIFKDQMHVDLEKCLWSIY
jgi:O-6-methylguanine DNA methyltransferase